MLTCSGCRVARFCSADHQKMASKKAALGGSLTTGRHKDICGVLRKWREAVKDGVAPDSCTAELVAFLQRKNARCPSSIIRRSPFRWMRATVCSSVSALGAPLLWCTTRIPTTAHSPTATRPATSESCNLGPKDAEGTPDAGV